MLRRGSRSSTYNKSEEKTLCPELLTAEKAGKHKFRVQIGSEERKNPTRTD